MKKICCKCKDKKDIEAFGINKTNADGRQKYCRDCKRGIARRWYNSACKDSHIASVKKNNRRYRKQMQDFVWDYLKQHPCSCGQTDPIVLEFDHKDCSKKESEISAMMCNGGTLKRLRKEIKKCRVLCSYCHKRKTAKEFRHWKYLKSIENAPVAQLDEQHGPNVKGAGSSPARSTTL